MSHGDSWVKRLEISPPYSRPVCRGVMPIPPGRIRLCHRVSRPTYPHHMPTGQSRGRRRALCSTCTGQVRRQGTKEKRGKRRKNIQAPASHRQERAQWHPPRSWRATLHTRGATRGTRARTNEIQAALHAEALLATQPRLRQQWPPHTRSERPFTPKRYSPPSRAGAEGHARLDQTSWEPHTHRTQGHGGRLAATQPPTRLRP